MSWSRCRNRQAREHVAIRLGPAKPRGHDRLGMHDALLDVTNDPVSLLLGNPGKQQRQRNDKHRSPPHQVGSKPMSHETMRD